MSPKGVRWQSRPSVISAGAHSLHSCNRSYICVHIPEDCDRPESQQEAPLSSSPFCWWAAHKAGRCRSRAMQSLPTVERALNSLDRHTYPPNHTTRVPWAHPQSKHRDSVYALCFRLPSMRGFQRHLGNASAALLACLSLSLKEVSYAPCGEALLGHSQNPM